MGYVLKGKRIDIGTWEYLKEERDFYSKMNDDELDKIIESRYDKLQLVFGTTLSLSVGYNGHLIDKYKKQLRPTKSVELSENK